MKLYATTTSEMDSKGQGGNEYLFIEIMNERKEIFLQVHITQARSHMRGEHQNIYIYNPKSEYLSVSENILLERDKSKGKQKKDEPYKGSQREADDEAFDFANATKGKQKKDEVDFGTDDETNNPSHPAFGID